MYQKQLTQTSVIMAGGHLLKVAKERTELCLQVCVLDHRVAEWPAGGGKKTRRSWDAEGKHQAHPSAVIRAGFGSSDAWEVSAQAEPEAWVVFYLTSCVNISSQTDLVVFPGTETALKACRRFLYQPYPWTGTALWKGTRIFSETGGKPSTAHA